MLEPYELASGDHCRVGRGVLEKCGPLQLSLAHRVCPLHRGREAEPCDSTREVQRITRKPTTRRSSHQPSTFVALFLHSFGIVPPVHAGLWNPPDMPKSCRSGQRGPSVSPRREATRKLRWATLQADFRGMCCMCGRRPQRTMSSVLFILLVANSKSPRRQSV